ncbi:MAG TPA: translocation/assembly module TamB domain-containing protein, partial [Fibrobacteraceae bacterium]|nr:translocation/assembly module TamB domain-containing protein [Fibrobacteraceae bacterium]
MIGVLLFTLGVCAWLGLRWLHERGVEELAKPRTFGPVTFIPEGFVSHGWLHYHWDRIRLQMTQTEITLVAPEIYLRLANAPPFREHIWLSVDSLHVQISPKTSGSDSLRKECQYRFPNFYLPLRFLATVRDVDVHVQGQAHWHLDSLLVRNTSRDQALLELRDISGSYLPHTMALDLSLSWTSRQVTAELNARGQRDSLWTRVQAPSRHLETLSGDLFLRLVNPKAWSPRSLPQNLPSFQNLNLRSQFHCDLVPLNLQWQGDVNLDVGDYSRLPAGHLRASSKGQLEKSIQLDLNWQGNGGQTIVASVERTPSGILRGHGSIRHFLMTIGSRQMPVDGDILHMERRSDTVEVDVRTQAGSRVSADLVNLSDPMINVQAQISPTEPWALDWCDGNLQIAPPSLIEGEYHRGVLTANVKTSVPYAYKTTAESFETDLTLSSKGIHFDNGGVLSRGQRFSLTGEVVWDSLNPHFQFEVLRDSGGVARVFGNFDGHLSLAVSALPTRSLPFADTGIFHGIQAIVTGSWEHWFQDRTGSLRAIVETNYHGIPLTLQATAHQHQDTLALDNVLAETQGNRLQGSAWASHDTLPDAPILLNEAQISTHGFSLPALLRSLGDSTLGKASLQGEMRWSRGQGLQGLLTIPEVTLHQMPAEQVRLQRLRILGDGDQVQVSSRVRLGKDGFWDGETEINLKHLFSPQRELSAALVADNGGVFWLQGLLDSSKIWNGDLHLEGPWLLPGGSSEFREIRFEAQLRADLRKGLAGLSGPFSLDTAILATSSLQLPLTGKGFLDSGTLRVDSLFLYGEEQTRIQTGLTFDLLQRDLSDIRIASSEFHLTFQGIHKLVLQSLQGSAQKNDEGLRIAVLLPEIRYQAQDSSFGIAHAHLGASLAIQIPTGASRSNKRISGSIDVKRLTYAKNFDVVPDTRWLQGAVAKATSLFGRLSSKKKTKQTTVSTGTAVTSSSPTELNLDIIDAGSDSLWIKTNVVSFPFTLNLQLQGTTDAPLLDGDLNMVGQGSLGVENFSTFDLTSLRVWWQDTPPLKGQLDITATKDVPYCSEDDDDIEETCPVTVSVTGPLTKPVPVPSADCKVETTPTQIYYSIFLLGCFSTDESNSLDRNEVVNKLLNMGLSSVSAGINKG